MSAKIQNLQPGIYFGGETNVYFSKEEIANSTPISDEKFAKPYQMGIINIGGLCLVLGAMRPIGAQKWGTPFAIPRVCRNCDQTYDVCFKNHQWTMILSVNCDSAAFELAVVDAPDANGQSRGVMFAIHPNCNYGGAILGVG
jgi:hypothetical protein